MTEAIAHRGPDGEGYDLNGEVGFGHRRLAVIDLTSAGQQPMRTADARFVLNYNGEVYNFEALRLELQRLGYEFRSRTDTEVVLNALAHWGLDALPRLNGMFALALWDRESRVLTLARDRYGVKPLYWTVADDCFLFGSEIKALLAHPAVKAALDAEGLAEYLSFQNFFSERTLFRDIQLLPHGSVLRLSPRDRTTPLIERWWDYEFREPETGASKREYIEELQRLFAQAVSRQLVADTPVASYLSGGMDSGSITAVAASQVPEMRSFTVGFDLHSASGIELGFDERASAERMSYLYGTEHYQMVLKAGDMERALARLVWHLEEPRVGQSYPNFYAAQLAAKFGKVVLSGTGGDELFGGYPWRYYRANGGSSFGTFVSKYHGSWQRLLSDRARAALLSPLGDTAASASTEGVMRDVFLHPPNRLSGAEDYINQSLYFEARTFLHGLLVVEDKLSMAHGLETRVPFLDNDLVDFAQRVPVGLKVGTLGEVPQFDENEPGLKREKFFERTNDGKLLLRQAMSRYIPEEVTQAVKQGFSAPDASWFRGESIDYVRRTLLDRDARIYEFLSAETARGLISEHLSGRANRRLLIWSLLFLEQWCRTFLEAGPGED